MPEAVIIDALRTPIGNLGGKLSTIRPDDLAAMTIKAIIERNQLDPALIEEVYLGCANQAGEDNRNVARMAALLASAGVCARRHCQPPVCIRVDRHQYRRPLHYGRGWGCFSGWRCGEYESGALRPAQIDQFGRQSDGL